MNQAAFLTALEQELQLRAVAFSRAELLAFVADVWALAQENPDVTLWAQEFIDANRGTMLA